MNGIANLQTARERSARTPSHLEIQVPYGGSRLRRHRRGEVRVARWAVSAKDPKLKTLGLWGRENFLSVLQGLSMAVMMRGLAMSAAEVVVFLARVREEARGRKVHCYAPSTFAYGRKPEAEEGA